jgi:thiol-disulfide isomerase/thioredoxin
MSQGSEKPTQKALGKYLLAACVAAALGFAGVYVTLGRPDNAADVRIPPAETGKEGLGPRVTAFVKKAVPEAAADVTFQGPDGQPVKLSDFKGKTVLLNLWATWCAPCRKEMPALDRLQKVLGSDKFEVVALAVDRAGAAAAKKFLDDIKVESLKLYVDPTAKAGTGLKALGLPTTILIDKDGREIGRMAGPAEWDDEESKALIQALLD